MTNPGPMESQQELFHEFSPEANKSDRFPSLQKTPKPILISTSLEQIILINILAILLGCIIFFLGMVRGKSLNLPKVSAGLPVKAATPAVSVPPVQDLSKPYTIQLVTYKKQAWAEQEASALRKKGYFATILTSGDYYLVCAGQYASTQEAKRDLKLLGAKHKDCFLRRL